jgi:hypothetical protein
MAERRSTWWVWLYDLTDASFDPSHGKVHGSTSDFCLEKMPVLMVEAFDAINVNVAPLE